MIDISKGRFWDLPLSLVDGCTPCSPGCDHCWSAAMAHRFGARRTKENPFADTLTNSAGKFTGKFNGKIIIHPDRLSIPLKRRKPTVYAVWNDLFHEEVPMNFLEDALAVMTNCPQHTFLVLTKRVQRLNLMTSDRLRISRTDTWPIKNLWLGITVCNQQEADEKIPIFLQVPGKKFLSFEPMLGKIIPPLVSRPWCEDCKGTGFYGDNGPGIRGNNEYGACDCARKRRIDAVILGGETGSGARPMHPDWVRSIRDQCAAAGGVPFFFKGWGTWKPCDDDHADCEGHKSMAMRLSGEIVTDEKPEWKDKAFGGPDQGFWKAGSKADRRLDGRTHDDLPWNK